MEPVKRNAAPARLGLWDAFNLILGIIIGVGIFETPSDVFRLAPHPGWVIAVWLLGGLLALVGALCFAELASTYPRSGGEYVYLTRAYGPMIGYLFAWAQLTVIRPGGIGALAYVFAHFAAGLWGLNQGGLVLLALSAVALLTTINILGVTLGKNTQNVLTVFKVLGLAGIVAAGLLGGQSRQAWEAPAAAAHSGWFATAMIFVLWTYAGWHEAAYIAAEVKDRQRNLPRALILGAAAVTVIYLLYNLAILNAVGMSAASSKAALPNVIRGVLPGVAAQAWSVLVMVSALGALNGMIFTTARIYTEFGADHRLFTPLSHWSKRLGTPARALAVQGLISLALVVGIGVIGHGRDSFDEMVAVTAAVFWSFFCLTGLSLFVLRKKDPDLPRPFRVPLYPWLPLLFCGCCLYMTYGAIEFRSELSLLSLLILLAGLPFYFWPQKRKRVAAPVEEPEPVGST